MYKEKFGSHNKRPFDRFTTKDSCTWNCTNKTESAAVWSLKSEEWGSALVQGEKCGEKRAVTGHDDDDDDNNKKKIVIIIIIIIIIIMLLIIM